MSTRFDALADSYISFLRTNRGEDVSNDTAVNQTLSTSWGHGSTSDTTSGVCVEPDIDTIVTFLKTVYPEYPPGVVGFTAFTVTSRSKNVPQRLGEWLDRNVVQDHEWLAERMLRLAEGVAPEGKESAEYFPYVPVTGIFLRLPTTMAEWPNGNQRGGQSNVQALIGFVLDGDIGEEGHKRNKDGLPNPSTPAEVMDIWAEAIAGKPTMVWNSGNGVNGFWGLDKPIVLPDGDEGAALLAAWRAASQRFHERAVRAAAARKKHHDSVPNNDRLMRVAGTVNAKKGTTPKLSTILSSDGPRYSLTDLLALAPEPIETEDGALVDAITGEVVREARKFRPVTGNGSAHAARGGYEAGETSWEHYSREMWETGGFLQMIQLDGFTPEGYHGGILHLWRPGKGPGEQISATFGANDGTGALSYGAKLYVFSSGAPGLLGVPKYQGGALERFIDPYEYLTYTRYNGERTACASALYRLGFGSRYIVPQGSEDGPGRLKTIALEAVQAIRASTDWKTTVVRQAARLASEGMPQNATEKLLLGCCDWGPDRTERVSAYISAVYARTTSA
jgi:hypothetical protein